MDISQPPGVRRGAIHALRGNSLAAGDPFARRRRPKGNVEAVATTSDVGTRCGGRRHGLDGHGVETLISRSRARNALRPPRG